MSLISLPRSASAPTCSERRVDLGRRQVGDQQRDAARREQRAQRADVRAVERLAQLGEAGVDVADDLQQHQLQLRQQAARDDDVERAGQGARRRARRRRRRCHPARRASAARRDHGSSRSNIPDASTGACATSWARARGGTRAIARATASGSMSHQVNLGEARRQRVQVDVVGVAGAEQAEPPAPDAGARSAISCVRRARCSANVASWPVALSFDAICSATAVASGPSYLTMMITPPSRSTTHRGGGRRLAPEMPSPDEVDPGCGRSSGSGSGRARTRARRGSTGRSR